MDDQPEPHLGQALRDARVHIGLTQQELAAAAGIGVGTVRDLEQGRSGRPRASSVRAIAAVLGLSPQRQRQLQELTRRPAASAPEPGPVHISVLGPLAVMRSGKPVPLGSGRHRIVLARLALTPDRPVGREELVHLLWGERAPATSANVVQTHVSRLRRVLEPKAAGSRGRLVDHEAGSYRLRAREENLDLIGYRSKLSRAGSATHDPARAFDMLSAALDMWRGDHPADDVPELAGDPLVIRLCDEYVEAAVRLSRLGEQLRRQQAVLPLLRRLSARHPWHESLHARLVLALAASGQQAAALEAYDAVRGRLADELGIDPGPELSEAHRAVLRGQPDHREVVHAAPPRHDRPWQAPAPPRDFAGRGAELRRLEALLSYPAHRAGVPASAVCVISGMAGVGKTSLALQAAHALRRNFPDGQVHIDLRGADSRPAPSGYALTRLLHSLGVQGRAVPVDPDEAAALYRSLLRERRVLVILDNAANSAQVRPLLPGPGGSSALVTSRNHCAELDTAEFLELAVLGVDEALEMLAARVGRERVQADPARAAALVEACGRLPVALRVIASRLAVRPGWSMSDLVDRLADERSRLEQLSIGDVAVTASFDLSRRELAPLPGRIFRTAALIPGTGFSAAAVAALLPADPNPVRRALDTLVGDNLLQRDPDGRYRYHDLLRLYAVQSAGTARDGAEATAALGRLLDWYLARVAAAMRLVYAEMVRLPLDIEVEPDTFADVDAARRWLGAEIESLVVAINAASGGAHQCRAWQLADQLRGYFFVTRDVAAWLATGQAGLAAAEAADDPQAQAAMHQTIGQAYWAAGKLQVAASAYRLGVAAARRSGWAPGEAYLLHNLGVVAGELGDLDEAQRLYRRVLEFCTGPGFDHIRAATLNDLGSITVEQGRLTEAVGYYEAALAINKGSSRIPSATANRSNLGMVLRQLEEFEAAHGHLEAALRYYRGADNRAGQMAVLDELSHLYRQIGERPPALASATEAVAIARELNDRRSLAATLTTLGLALLDARAVADAQDRFSEALRLSRDHGFPYSESQAGVGIAAALLQSGLAEQAYATASEAHCLADRRRFDQQAGDALLVMARAALALGDLTAAAARCRSARDETSRPGRRRACDALLAEIEEAGRASLITA